jgi:hypothetical protein
VSSIRVTLQRRVVEELSVEQLRHALAARELRDRCTTPTWAAEERRLREDADPATVAALWELDDLDDLAGQCVAWAASAREVGIDDDIAGSELLRGLGRRGLDGPRVEELLAAAGIAWRPRTWPWMPA